MNAPQRTAWLHPDTTPVLAVATSLGGVLAAVSFALSFVALRDVSSWAGIGHNLAWAVPVMLDAAILVYTLAILVKRARRENAGWTWATLALWTSVSVAANAAHAGGVPEDWQRVVGTVVAGLAPIAVLLATHTIADLIVAPVSADPPAVAIEPAASAVPDATGEADMYSADAEPDADSEPDTSDAQADSVSASGEAVATSAVDDAPDAEPDTDGMDGGADADSGADEGAAIIELPAPVPAVAPVAVRRHPRARAGVRVAECRDEIVRLRREEGLPVRAIAERVGLGKTAVAGLLREVSAV